MTAPDPTACDGSFVCDAAIRIHGCFSDDGRCEEPGEHGRTDPTAEHIDAVARAIRPWAWGRRADRQRIGARLDADRVLTSTDPLVHAALAASLPAEVKIASLTDAEMLAALVDRGTLTEETEDIIGFHDETCPDPCPFGKRRRLATTWTPWRVAP